MTTNTPTFGEDGRHRILDRCTVTKLKRGETHTSIDCGGSGFMTANEYADQLAVGAEFDLELVQGSTITGIFVAGRWLYRKSDQDLAAEREERSASWARQKQEELDLHRDEWIRQEAELPAWIQDRIDTFRARGGDYFELEGWGYELAVARLAVAYVASDLQEDESVKVVDQEVGASGNQHGMAKALARAHLAGESLAETISALSPLTGDAFYEGGAKS